MCPANGELENGDPESPVEFLCEVAHLRALVLGFEIPAHGECEFCPGGENYEHLMESAGRIATSGLDREEWARPQELLPVLNNSSPGAGCGGCGSFH
jgi:hypothetical protein